MNALCPNCRSEEGEVTDRARDPEAGLRVALSCPECEHDWDVTL